MKTNKTNIIFIMGVSGVGKSTIGNLLSEELNIPFFDGDDFHPEENILKMSKGLALNDNDRFGWLQKLNKLAVEQQSKNGAIIACSALKKSYRDILHSSIKESTKFVFLDGSFNQIKERINARKGHFMNSELLKSQFDTLEIPQNAIKIDISLTPHKIVKLISKEIVDKAEFGLFGLGVMGKSLSRNLANNGFKIALFNRHVKDVEVDVAKNFKNDFEELSTALPFDDIESFVNSLQKPRKIMLMVNAGKIVDYVIEDLLPFLDAGDILIDGGNSNYHKTKERFDYLKSKDINFVGTGVSGGEEGALKGPSIMPGGNKETYNEVKPYLEAIAAKDANNLPCCTHIGTEGSGHFVKMVHNGIEYVEMQLLAEVYTILKALGNNPDEIANILEGWKETTNSYLLEITIDILRKKEGEDWLVDKIMDKAGNKGTGNWTTITTAQLGVPSTMITSALFARYISFYKEERIVASKNLETNNTLDINFTIEDVLKAYQFARLINHYQGFKLIHEASESYNWSLNLSELARIWTNGCIIRSDLMVELVTTFKSTKNMLTDEKIIQQLKKLKPSIKKVVSQCVLNELATPNLNESISFLNSFAIENSSANLIQAQRDYFGAHTYQLKNDKTNKFYHTDWTKN
ncbi:MULTISPECIES: NADP-dependent phosphogluconate dehydrogenase [Tenacibaculum]|uniref:NADP-dependent phosphogluconate dehydrogenase n=1 Tax=Tenacibaculum TaxID=104267 RepID=UPI001F0A78FA|nr:MULTISPECIES: NADP-dependent phosphogluconate dehydrogenase [Tenacibaculum]MCH3882283.1 NADP-dependent phosphogluconate dehydrogenase [Tenacibaculum aquimarinum]MDO6599915.1 NADP-dependent phosphogluconate dehydrogenase [Tenacibaculum sp. 1_MG-2023]